MKSILLRFYFFGEKMKFESYGNCFVCGENNPKGLKLSFEIDKEKQTLKTSFVAGSMFQGADGNVHEGIITILSDEATSKFCLNPHKMLNTCRNRSSFAFMKPFPPFCLRTGQV
jgi:hypothetical protein